MNDILFKVNEAIRNYYNKYGREPNTILINENDLDLLNHSLPKVFDDKVLALKNKMTYKCFDLNVVPIKYGEVQAVEVIEQ